MSLSTESRMQVPSRVSILGAGVSGLACARLLERNGAQVRLFDERGQAGASEDFSGGDVVSSAWVVNSPGFRKNHPWIELARNLSVGEQLSETEAARRFWTGRCTAVTGTNGKTTITELLAACLKTAGLDARVGGNIGVPFSELALAQHNASTWAVIEASSFQSWNLKGCPFDGVIWSNIDEDHLDWHSNMEDYFLSKWKLVEMAGHHPVIMGEDVACYARGLGLTLPPQTRVVSLRDAECESPTLSLPNRINASLVRSWMHAFGMDGRILDETLVAFRFPRHRFEYVGSVDGVDYWNDSKGTNFHAVYACLESFDRPVLWLGGGLAKGGNIAAFCHRIAPQVSRAFVFGSSAQTLVSAFENEDVSAGTYPSLEAALEAASREGKPGDQVVLSPGFASFDQFTGYAERGRRFEAWVREAMKRIPEICLSHT